MQAENQTVVRIEDQGTNGATQKCEFESKRYIGNSQSLVTTRGETFAIPERHQQHTFQQYLCRHDVKTPAGKRADVIILFEKRAVEKRTSVITNVEKRAVEKRTEVITNVEKRAVQKRTSVTTNVEKRAVEKRTEVITDMCRRDHTCWEMCRIHHIC